MNDEVLTDIDISTFRPKFVKKNDRLSKFSISNDVEMKQGEATKASIKLDYDDQVKNAEFVE
jgi:hypothetical protein